MTITRSGNFYMNSTLWCKESSSCAKEHCKQRHAKNFGRHKKKLFNGCRLRSQRFCLTRKFAVPEKILSVIYEKASRIKFRW